jgi:hypothetical protein
MKRFIPDPSEVIPAPDDNNHSTWLDTVALTIGLLSIPIFFTAFIIGEALGLYPQTTETIAQTSMLTMITGFLYTSRHVFFLQ